MSDADDLRQAMQHNPVFSEIKALVAIFDSIARGSGESAVVSGPAGVGKNWLFEAALARHDKLQYRDWRYV